MEYSNLINIMALPSLSYICCCRLDTVPAFFTHFPPNLPTFSREAVLNRVSFVLVLAEGGKEPVSPLARASGADCLTLGKLLPLGLFFLCSQFLHLKVIPAEACVA